MDNIDTGLVIEGLFSRCIHYLRDNSNYSEEFFIQWLRHQYQKTTDNETIPVFWCFIASDLKEFEKVTDDELKETLEELKN